MQKTIYAKSMRPVVKIPFLLVGMFQHFLFHSYQNIVIRRFPVYDGTREFSIFKLFFCQPLFQIKSTPIRLVLQTFFSQQNIFFFSIFFPKMDFYHKKKHIFTIMEQFSKTPFFVMMGTFVQNLIKKCFSNDELHTILNHRNLDSFRLFLIIEEIVS